MNMSYTSRVGVIGVIFVIVISVYSNKTTIRNKRLSNII